MSPSAKRVAVRTLVNEIEMSERHSCELLDVARDTARRTPAGRPDESAIRKVIVGEARRHKRYGYRRITALLRRKGRMINHKKVYRIWREEGLVPRRRPRRRASMAASEPLQRATHTHHVWAYDFVHDRTEKGVPLRFLNIIDEYTRECLAITVARSIDSAAVRDTLAWLFLTRGVPKYIRSDNGPEFIARSLTQWLTGTGAACIHITPGSPWENAHIESFNGKLRDECLTRETFATIDHARTVAENWRNEYNNYRPHSSLGYLTPAQYARTCGSSDLPTASLRFRTQLPPTPVPHTLPDTTTKALTLML